MHRSREVASAIVALALIYGCCDSRRNENFKIQTRSPQQTYSVELTGSKKPAKALPGEFYVQDVKLVTSKGKDVIVTDETFYHTDEYDPLFLEAYPVQHWINNSTLRLGNMNAQPFQDKINITNKTNDNLNLLIVNYGKYERFLIFDLPVGGSLELLASPQFEREWPAAGVSYTAYHKGGSFSGAKEGLNQRKLQDGPLKISVDVYSK